MDSLFSADLEQLFAGYYFRQNFVGYSNFVAYSFLMDSLFSADLKTHFVGY